MTLELFFITKYPLGTSYLSLRTMLAKKLPRIEEIVFELVTITGLKIFFESTIKLPIFL